MRAYRLALFVTVTLAALLVACAPQPAQAPQPTQETQTGAKDQAQTSVALAPLHVRGTRLVNDRDEPVKLRGISTHGLAWFPQYVNAKLFGELASDWHANVVRLAMYTAENDGYCTDGNKDQLRALVLDGVHLATDANLYAIVDWHILSDNNPLEHADEAEAFFRDTSRALADHDNVLYEICNEPNGTTTWADVKSYADRIIPVIRANDPDAVVIVGTPEWSQRVDQAAADPLPFDNVLYSLHFYAATHKDDLRARMNEAIRSGLPVFVSEFGICDASGNGSIDADSAASWVRAMDEAGVGYVMWNLSNKDESSSAIAAGCDKVAGFADGDLSTSGRWLRAVLADQVGQATADAQPERQVFESFSYTLAKRNSWPVGNKTCTQYDLTLTNDGAACDSWRVEVPFDTPIELADGWNGTYEVRDNTLVIANASYNGHVEANGTVRDVGFQLVTP